MAQGAEVHVAREVAATSRAQPQDRTAEPSQIPHVFTKEILTLFGQRTSYALVIVPGPEQNPPSGLVVVALPLPPVCRHPFCAHSGIAAAVTTAVHISRPVADPSRPAALTGVRARHLRVPRLIYGQAPHDMSNGPRFRLKARATLNRHSKAQRNRPGGVSALPPRAHR